MNQPPRSFPARSAAAVLPAVVTFLGGLFLLDVLVMAWQAYSLELGEACRLTGRDPRFVWLGLGALPLALAIAWRWLPGLLGRRGFFWVALASVVLTRAIAVFALDAPLVSDFLIYHTLAGDVARGGPWFTEFRPMGYPLVLGWLYGLLGAHVWVGEALNVGMAVVGGLFLYAMTARAWDRQAGHAALLLYGLYPAQALMATTLGTEVLYTTCFLAACWGIQHVIATTGHARALAWAAVVGVTLGLSQYIRPTSLALLPAFIGLLALLARPWRGAIAAVAVLTAAFLITLVPVALYNHQHGGHLSVSTSNFGGWSLLIGTNQQSSGTWNMADAHRIYGPGSVDTPEMGPRLRELDRLAAREGQKRLQSDPAGFLALVGRKRAIMWGSETYAVEWTLPGAQPRSAPKVRGMRVLTQAAYVLVLATALLGFLIGARRYVGWLALLVVGTVALVHAVVEVQPRYHFYVVPLFCALGGIALSALRRRGGGADGVRERRA